MHDLRAGRRSGPQRIGDEGRARDEIPVSANRGPLPAGELDGVAELLAPGPAEGTVSAHEIVDVDEGRLRDAFVAPGCLGFLEVDEVGSGRKLTHMREELGPGDFPPRSADALEARAHVSGRGGDRNHLHR